MSSAARTIKTHFDGQLKETITGHLYAATTKALAATEFPRCPTTSSLIAFLIVQTCLIREEEPLTTCSFIGMAMRVGMFPREAPRTNPDRVQHNRWASTAMAPSSTSPRSNAKSGGASGGTSCTSTFKAR